MDQELTVTDGPVEIGSAAAEPDAPAGPSIRDSLESAFVEETGKPLPEPTPADARSPSAPDAAQPPERDARAADRPPARDARDRVAALANQAAAERAVRAGYEKSSNVIEPLLHSVGQAKPYLDSLGVSPGRAFEILLNAEYTLRHGTPDQKLETLQRIVKDYNIDVSGLQAQQQPDEWRDPDVVKLEQQVQALHQAAATQEVHRAIAEIQAFEATKDAAGRRAYPHFAAVAEDMTRLALAERAAGRQPVLKTLYETAVWANPTVRARLIADQGKHGRSQRASASVTGGPRGGVAAGVDEGGNSIRAIMRRELAAGRL